MEFLANWRDLTPRASPIGLCPALNTVDTHRPLVLSSLADLISLRRPALCPTSIPSPKNF